MIISKVREGKNKQRRITIPSEDKTLKDGDLVGIMKVGIVKEKMQCEVCGRVPMTPRIHHINRDRKDNTKKNLITLCQDCHITIHNGKTKGRSYKRSNNQARKVFRNKEDKSKIFERDFKTKQKLEKLKQELDD